MKNMIVILIAVVILVGGYFLWQQTKEEPSKDTSCETDPETCNVDINNSITDVSIKNFAFSPQTITVSVGTTVTWKNEDSVPHTVTSQGNFDSGNLNGGEEFSFTFNTPGTFDYICTLHPFMTGKVIVE